MENSSLGFASQACEELSSGYVRTLLDSGKLPLAFHFRSSSYLASGDQFSPLSLFIFGDNHTASDWIRNRSVIMRQYVKQFLRSYHDLPPLKLFPITSFKIRADSEAY